MKVAPTPEIRGHTIRSGKARANLIENLRRALMIDHHGMKVSSIAEFTGLHPTTVRRILNEIPEIAKMSDGRYTIYPTTDEIEYCNAVLRRADLLKRQEQLAADLAMPAPYVDIAIERINRAQQRQAERRAKRKMSRAAAKKGS